MKSFSKYFAFFIIVLGLSFQCFASQNLKIMDTQSQNSENYYIKPGDIFITPSGIYASIDGTLVQINTLRADERGTFVPGEEIVGRLIKCSSCQHWYDPDDVRGHRCPGFPE